MYHLEGSDRIQLLGNAQVKARTKRGHDCLAYVTDMYTIVLRERVIASLAEISSERRLAAWSGRIGVVTMPPEARTSQELNELSQTRAVG